MSWEPYEKPPMDKDKVAVIHASYPGFDKAMYAKVKKPEHYGVRLVADAERLLREAFPTPEVKKAENRKLKYRVSFRMNKTLFTELERQLKRITIAERNEQKAEGT